MQGAAAFAAATAKMGATASEQLRRPAKMGSSGLFHTMASNHRAVAATAPSSTLPALTRAPRTSGSVVAASQPAGSQHGASAVPKLPAVPLQPRRPLPQNTFAMLPSAAHARRNFLQKAATVAATGTGSSSSRRSDGDRGSGGSDWMQVIKTRAAPTASSGSSSASTLSGAPPAAA